MQRDKEVNNFVYVFGLLFPFYILVPSLAPPFDAVIFQGKITTKIGNIQVSRDKMMGMRLYEFKLDWKKY